MTDNTSATATIEGTPTQNGTYVFTIEVSDTGTPVKYLDFASAEFVKDARHQG